MVNAQTETTAVSSHGGAENTVYRIRQNAEQRAAKIAAALTFQDTLTLAGKRKK